MRREQIIQSLLKVTLALDKLSFNRIMDQLRSVRGREGGDSGINTSEIFAKYSQYMIDYENFEDTEKSIIRAFELEMLSSSSFWASLIDKDGDPHALFTARYNIDALINATNKFLPLLVRQSDQMRESIEAVSSAGKQEQIEIKTQKFLMRESELPDVNIKVFVSVLNDIHNLYSIITQIYRLPAMEPLIGSIDSGSDKSFDVIGIADAISKLSTLFLETWDRVRFGKEQKIEKSFKAVSDGIDILDKIRSSADKKSISAEEAEKMRRGVIKSMENIISSGVYTPEIETRTAARPSQIPVQRQLLITYQEPDKQTDIENKNTATIISPPEQPKKRRAAAKNRLPRSGS